MCVSSRKNITEYPKGQQKFSQGNGNWSLSLSPPGSILSSPLPSSMSQGDPDSTPTRWALTSLASCWVSDVEVSKTPSCFELPIDQETLPLQKSQYLPACFFITLLNKQQLHTDLGSIWLNICFFCSPSLPLELLSQPYLHEWLIPNGKVVNSSWQSDAVD